MTCCDTPGLKPISEAMEIMRSKISALTEIEMVSLYQSLDRVLAEDVVSPMDIPPHANSAMDGFAFHSQAQFANEPLKLVGTALAGHPYYGSCSTNECVRIMTGAHLPDGLDTVVMQENTEQQGDFIHIHKWPKSGENIRLMGEDVSKHQKILNKGKRLGPCDLGLLAALGIAEVKVIRKLKVALIATGDELIKPGGTLADGEIFESNTLVLAAMLSRLNMEYKDYGIIKDDMDQLTKAFQEADQWADIVISSGGVSVGTADYTKDVLEKLGTIGFWKLAIKPGKPFAFGELSNSFFFGLPGNPVSATITFHQLAMPIMRIMQGETIDPPVTLHIPSNQPLKKHPGRQDFQRGTLLQNAEGELSVNSFRAQGSGILSSMSESNCYIVLPPQSGSVEAEQIVQVVPFDRFIC